MALSSDGEYQAYWWHSALMVSTRFIVYTIVLSEAPEIKYSRLKDF